MTEFKNGSVKISNIIIDQLIAEAALHVEGTKYVLGYNGKRVDPKKKEGIVSVIKGTDIDIALTVVLNTDQKIYEISEAIQKSIKEQVKVMLNLDARNINVFIKEVERAK